MKSRIIAAVAVVALIMFAILLVYAVVAYPAHLGEPSYYHTARVECLVAACACGLAAITSAIAAVHF